MAINARNWSAIIDAMPPNPPRLIVRGEVETTNSAIVPKLAEANPQGINPDILLLDLTLVNTGGMGTTDVSYRPVEFRRPTSPGTFSSVTILHEDDMIASVKVENVS